MKLSQLFTRTAKENPKDEASVNARLLERGGFVYKNSAGIYTYLPLGWRVIQKISNIIREEMNAIGGQEMYMPALHDKRYLTASGRWDVDVVFKVISGKDPEPSFNISWTHEEITAEIAKKYVNSYNDLPFSLYQFQTKFRDEPRAKSGLLRGREFLMKDLYSFHTDEKDLWRFYEEVKGAYHKIFHRCGLKAVYTVAAGGDFTSNNTHEFQVLSPVGEDTIYVCSKCEYSENKEIAKMRSGGDCPKCGGKIEEHRSIEVGNIFPLGTKYSEAFDLRYTNENGEKNYVVMGSYGIGLGRVMGTVVEVRHDDNGIMWPESVAPFKVHLIGLEGVKKESDKVYKELTERGVETLYDDRDEKMAGEKFADADLVGCPVRLVVSKKTVSAGKIELKKRNEKNGELLSLNNFVEQL